MTLMIRTYSELQKIYSFEDRFKYLSLSGKVGITTFGYDRYLNQFLYRSRRWMRIRDHVIIRDEGCDLGILDYIITGKIIIHHMNPISVNDIKNNDSRIYDPEFLICTSHETHRAIHYGDESLLAKPPIVRRPGDTIPWR